MPHAAVIEEDSPASEGGCVHCSPSRSMGLSAWPLEVEGPPFGANESSSLSTIATSSAHLESDTDRLVSVAMRCFEETGSPSSSSESTMMQPLLSLVAAISDFHRVLCEEGNPRDGWMGS